MKRLLKLLRIQPGTKIEAALRGKTVDLAKVEKDVFRAVLDGLSPSRKQWVIDWAKQEAGKQ